MANMRTAQRLRLCGPRGEMIAMVTPGSRVLHPAPILATALLTTLLALAVPARTASADMILLDEYWSPEIVVNDVVPTEIDTRATGDPTQAKFGECSVQLVNDTGAPSIRFRPAGIVVLDQIPVGMSEAGIWYRTDKWAGNWNLDLWVWHEPTAPAPVRVLTAALDGGGPAGALIADDQWHQARALLKPCDAYDKVPHDKNLVTYAWLAPTSGWNVKHRTFVDRIEVRVLDGKEKDHPPIPPTARVRPRPGAQTNGPGWIWFEGEDPVTSAVPPGGAFLPDNADQQRILSNGMWLQYHGSKDVTAIWQVKVAEAGRYAFWCRGLGGGFKWCWDDQDWKTCTSDSPWAGTVTLKRMYNGPIDVSWVCLGQVQLSAGNHVLQTEGLPDNGGTGFDCWLLTTAPFTPHRAEKPGGG
jgi:hypothetical protein